MFTFKKFKIGKLNITVDIGDLLKNYAKSLSENTNGALSCILPYRISEGKIIFEFKVKYDTNDSFKIFEICLLDIEGNLALTVFHFEKYETFYITLDKLEDKIDEIISSDEMGKFIGYLLLVHTIANRKQYN